jgi:antitoxin component YwqK of YwqJK toxin-antitoxin module
MLKMVEFSEGSSRFGAMKIAGVVLCAFAFLLIGCGDDGEGDSDISTTIINQGTAPTNTTKGAGNTVPSVDITTMKYIRRTNATAVVTNVVRVYYKGKKRFTGNAFRSDKDGTKALIPMKDGLWHGMFRITYPGAKQTKFRVNYIQGLKNGQAYGWYANGKPRSKSNYTNNFRVGPWITFHSNGKTNKVMVLSTKIRGKVLRRAAFDLNGRPLTGKTPAGRKHPWQVNGTDASKELAYYIGKPSSILTTAFGNPNQRRGEIWMFSGLTIRDMKSGQTNRTARFTVKNGSVAAVEILP